MLLYPTSDLNIPSSRSTPTKRLLLPNLDDVGPDSSEVLRESSPQRIEFQKQNGNKLFWDLIRRSFTYPSRASFSDANIMWVLNGQPLANLTTDRTLKSSTTTTSVTSRLGAVPLAFIFNSILNGDSHSPLALASSLLGIFGLDLTVMVSTAGNTAGDVLLAVSVPILDALLPILLLDTCFDRSPCFLPQESITDDHHKVTACSWQDSRLQEASRRFWSTLRQVFLLLTLSLLPIFLFSVEPQDIR